MKLNTAEFLLMNNPLRRFIQDIVEIRPFIDFANQSKNWDVLEIGCGNGNGAKLIDKYFHPIKIHGIDLDPKMIKLTTGFDNNKFDFRVGDVTKLQFKSNSLNGIFDFGVLHHVANWEKAIRELHRVLCKGGYVFIEDFSVETFQSPLGNLMRKVLTHPYSSMYYRNDLIQRLRQVGFKIVKLELKKPLGLLDYFVIVAVNG